MVCTKCQPFDSLFWKLSPTEIFYLFFPPPFLFSHMSPKDTVCFRLSSKDPFFPWRLNFLEIFHQVARIWVKYTIGKEINFFTLMTLSSDFFTERHSFLELCYKRNPPNLFTRCVTERPLVWGCWTHMYIIFKYECPRVFNHPSSISVERFSILSQNVNSYEIFTLDFSRLSICHVIICMTPLLFQWFPF